MYFYLVNSFVSTDLYYYSITMRVAFVRSMSSVELTSSSYTGISVPGLQNTGISSSGTFTSFSHTGPVKCSFVKKLTHSPSGNICHAYHCCSLQVQP